MRRMCGTPQAVLNAGRIDDLKTLMRMKRWIGRQYLAPTTDANLAVRQRTAHSEENETSAGESRVIDEVADFYLQVSE